MLFNARVNSNGKSLTELKAVDLPKLSEVKQDSKDTFIQDIHYALEKVEVGE